MTGHKSRFTPKGYGNINLSEKIDKQKKRARIMPYMWKAT